MPLRKFNQLQLVVEPGYPNGERHLFHEEKFLLGGGGEGYK